jgi:hypothetical protein
MEPGSTAIAIAHALTSLDSFRKNLEQVYSRLPIKPLAYDQDHYIRQLELDRWAQLWSVAAHLDEWHTYDEVVADARQWLGRHVDAYITWEREVFPEQFLDGLSTEEASSA